MITESDPFASVRLRKLPEVSQKDNQNVNEDPFSSVRIKKSEEFPGVYETGRHAARIGSRIAETIGGIPGDVSKLIESGVFSGLEKLTGYKLSKEDKENYQGERAPTSQELKKASQKVTGGFTSPQSETEKVVDEYAETVASLLGPMKFRRALGVGLASNLAKQGLKISGIGEGGQELGKLGTMFLATMYNPGGAMKYAASQYNKANQLAKGASIYARPLELKLSQLVTDLQKGVTTPSKNSVIKPAEELIQKIQNGHILIEDLTSSKRDMNTLIKDPAMLVREKKLLNTINHAVDDAIKPYEKINPQFSEAYRPANEIFGTVMQAQKASDFIKNTLGAKSIYATLLGESFFKPELIPATIGLGVSAMGAAKSYDMIYRIMKSPVLRKIYIEGINSALKDDARALIKSNNELESKLQQK